MPVKLERTRHPGIYRAGSRYVIAYRVAGVQKRERAATLKEALRIKRSREADRDRGEYQEESRQPFADFARDWVRRYRGNGRRGFTEETRRDYARDLERHALPFFADRMNRTVSQITPRDVDRWIAWLCDEKAQGRRLADATVRRIVSPVRACLAAARREGLIRSNPADGAVLPHREEVAAVGEAEDRRRALSRRQLDTILRVAHPGHRALLEMLAGTGLRWGEAAALRRGDLALDGSAPCVRVRRAVTKAGRFKPPKSRHGLRDVPLSPALVLTLRAHLSSLRPDGPDALAFPSRAATPLAYPNALRRVLRPAAEEAGAPWAGFHTFRHTFASLHLARGTNIVALSRMLGHHSPAFTLSRYAHLIPGDDLVPLDLTAELENASAAPRVDRLLAPGSAASEPSPAANS